MDVMDIQTKDRQYNWHPCSQMKDYEKFKPLVIQQARESWIELQDGKRLIDAISSWWCKSLGHNHPALKKALTEQMEQFEHVIFANTTNEKITNLSQVLANLMPGLNKVFYTGDGSSAIETAMKMSLHSRVIQGKPHKTKFVALSNGYHGETSGALSVSDLGLYRKAYTPLLFEPILIGPPYVTGMADPRWDDANDAWEPIRTILEKHKHTITAILFEPVLQGAAGMRIYSQDFLSKLAAYAKENDIHLIADEIMTGIGRTGKMLACEHAKIKPDFICLSKGLTSGWLAFSTVLTTPYIYDTFYADYEEGKSFLHSHTYSGNVLGASVALATLKVIQHDKLCERAHHLHVIMRDYFQQIADQTGLIQNVRGIGAAIAADLIEHPSDPRIGFTLYQEAVKLGALLRPLGNTIYWTPPLNIAYDTLAELKDITCQALLNVFR